MSGQTVDRLEVAPREIHDLVYACCRVEGLDSGLADSVAASVATTEILFGSGIDVFANVVANLGSQGLADSAIATAADRWRQTEIELRGGGSGRLIFASPTPLAAIGGALADSLGRGIVARWHEQMLIPGAQGAPDLSGRSMLDEVELLLVAGDEDDDVGQAELQRLALSQGVMIPVAVYQQLKAESGRFLVSESTVDAVAE